MAQPTRTPAPPTSPPATPASTPAPPTRTPAQIETDIERTRLHLQGTIDAIADRVAPANIARRGTEKAKAQVLDPEGSLRTTRVIALVAGAALVVGLVVWRRRR